MEREHHIMFSMFSTLPTDCQRTLRATLALLLASASFLGNRAFGQAATTGQPAAIHAGWQAGYHVKARGHVRHPPRSN